MAPKKLEKGEKLVDDDGPLGCTPEMRRPPAPWIEAVLKAINSRRAAHWTPPLVWNDDAFNAARRQAEKCMEANVAYNGHCETLDGFHGQCLRGPLKPPVPLKAKSVEELINFWYAEAPRYDFENPGPSEKAANFTQLIWGGTTSVGMALSLDGRFCVANFFPAGNSEQDYLYVRYVRQPQSGAPPWHPHDVPEPKVSALSADNWEAHGKLEESMRKAAALMPELGDISLTD